MRSIAEIEKARDERKAAQAAERLEQEAIDLDAIDTLEAAEGCSLFTMSSNGFRPGVPVKIAFRTPKPVEYKRYCDMVGKAQAQNDPLARRKAQELLAAACLVYPTGDAQKSMLDAFPGVLISLAIEAAKAAELSAENESK